VRGARIVLVDGSTDTDGVRAPVTAHWPAQLGWEVAGLDAPQPAELEAGPWCPDTTAPPAVDTVSVDELAQLLAYDAVTPLNFAPSAEHVRGHIPGACWVRRSELGRTVPFRSRRVASFPRVATASWPASRRPICRP
jgi:hypothetical protein